MKKPKVCIVSIAAYPLLTRKDIEIVGGTESQSVLLAKELRKMADIIEEVPPYDKKEGSE